MVRNKGEKYRCYSLRQCKRSDYFDIFNDRGEYIILVQLMENLGNVSNDATIFYVWIFGANFKIAITLIRGYLDLICTA